MKKFRFFMPLFFIGIFALLSAILMWIWNWLMPLIFGLTTINFWQSLGLIIMSRILFGGHHFSGHPHGIGGLHGKRFPRPDFDENPRHHMAFSKRKEAFIKKMEAVNNFWADLEKNAESSSSENEK